MHQHFGKRLQDFGGKPYQDAVLNRAYDQFFCDDIEAFRSGAAEQTYPWDLLLSKKETQEDWTRIADDGAVESRAKVFAYRHLKRGDHHLYGAIVEVSLDKSVNVVAGYRDGSARAINGGRIIDWVDVEDEEIREALVTFLSSAQYVMTHLDPWTKPRLPFPNPGTTRFSILSSDGFYFAQGAMDKMLKDPLGQPIVESAMDLMMKLSMKVK